MNPKYYFSCASASENKIETYKIKIPSGVIFNLKTDAPRETIENLIKTMKQANKEFIVILEAMLDVLGYKVESTIQREEFDFQL